MKNEINHIPVKSVVYEFWQSIKVYKWSLFISIVATLVPPLASVAMPLYYRQFFNTLAAATGDKTHYVSALLAPIIVVFALNLIAWLGWRILAFSGGYFQAKTMAQMRQRAFSYLMSHSYAFFTNNFTGSLTQKVNKYARAFERLSDRFFYNMIPLSIRVVGVIIVVWTIRPSISIVIMVWTVIFMAVQYILARARLPYDLARSNADTRATAVLSDVITNQNTVDLFSGYEREEGLYREVTDEQANLTLKSWYMQGYVEAIQAFLIIVMEFLLFYFTIRYWSQGFVTIGTFVLLQSYLIGLGSQLWDFSRVIRDFYDGFSDAREMVEIIRRPQDVKDAPNAGTLTVTHGEVRFTDVVFAFNPSRTVLNHVELTIPAGQKVALVGPSGAGKSTLVRLLLRFYDITSGAITIDGQNIATVTQESLHDNVSFVPQDPVLFHRTLMENIRYGRPSATDAEVLEASSLAHCHEFIKDLPKGYDTYVGERGIKLSGGERQRVAIARAILKNAPILVLDEATSSLDSHSEMLIQQALDTLMKGKTTIVIAHRLSTIRKMDRILTIEHGAIAQDGTHEALSEKEGIYKKLWKLQAGGFLPTS
jgi:ATP-binding cassette, subfamily B, bacterial